MTVINKVIDRSIFILLKIIDVNIFLIINDYYTNFKYDVYNLFIINTGNLNGSFYRYVYRRLFDTKNTIDMVLIIAANLHVMFLQIGLKKNILDTSFTIYNKIYKKYFKKHYIII